MLARHPMKRRLLGSIGPGLARDRRGAAAVEFAIIAPIFLGLLFSIIEAGYFFFVSSAVDQATARAARLIRTGEVQSASAPMSRDDFFNRICDVVRHFGDCSQRLTVDVSRFSSFADLAKDLSQPVCRDADIDTVNNLPFEAGAQREIIRVRVCFLHKSINPAIGLNLAESADGSRKLISVAIFRNEPYSS